MSKTTVVNCRTEKDWDVYVGRPSLFGNPYKEGIHGTRSEVVSHFEYWIRKDPILMRRVKQELKGKRIACWCAPAQCHADVLAEIADEPEVSA